MRMPLVSKFICQKWRNFTRNFGVTSVGLSLYGKDAEISASFYHTQSRTSHVITLELTNMTPNT